MTISCESRFKIFNSAVFPIIYFIQFVNIRNRFPINEINNRNTNSIIKY